MAAELEPVWVFCSLSWRNMMYLCGLKIHTLPEGQQPKLWLWGATGAGGEQRGPKGQQLVFTQIFSLENNICSFLLLPFNSVWGWELWKNNDPLIQVKLLCLHINLSFGVRSSWVLKNKPERQDPQLGNFPFNKGFSWWKGWIYYMERKILFLLTGWEYIIVIKITYLIFQPGIILTDLKFFEDLFILLVQN